MFNKKTQKEKHKDLSLEEKVDLLLYYQESARLWSKVGALVKVALLVIFVVLPIVFAIGFVKDIVSNIGAGGAQSFFQNLQSPQEGIASFIERFK